MGRLGLIAIVLLIGLYLCAYFVCLAPVVQNLSVDGVDVQFRVAVFRPVEHTSMANAFFSPLLMIDMFARPKYWFNSSDQDVIGVEGAWVSYPPLSSVGQSGRLVRKSDANCQ